MRPFHDTSLYQGGSNHNYDGFLIDRDNGAMDGFVEEQEKWQPPVCRTNPGANPYRCPGYKIHDVMGYHDWREIPNYWHYAESYMLQDHLFAPVGQASAGIHLMLTSEWSADCRNPKNPMSCVFKEHTALAEAGRASVRLDKPDLAARQYRRELALLYSRGRHARL